jgi:hypothetical protein
MGKDSSNIFIFWISNMIIVERNKKKDDGKRPRNE